MRPSIFSLFATFVLVGGSAAGQPVGDDRSGVVSSMPTDARSQIIDLMQNGPLNIGVDTAAWERNFHPEWTVWFAGSETPRARADHMPAVYAYVESGAVVTGYELDVVSLDVFGAVAQIRYNAVETIREGDGNLRVVPYSGTDVLVFEDGRWWIRSSSLSFPARYRDGD